MAAHLEVLSSCEAANKDWQKQMECFLLEMLSSEFLCNDFTDFSLLFHVPRGITGGRDRDRFSHHLSMRFL